jgi:hypothetical protein
MKKTEELTSFNIKKNVCLNCLKSIIDERENTNNAIINDINCLKNAKNNLNSDMLAREVEEINNLNEEDLIQQEIKLNKEINDLIVEDEKTRLEVESHLKELSDLHKEEQNCWDVFGKIEEVTLKFERNKQFVMNKYRYYESEIKQFSNMSLIDSIFSITCYDKYGVINGARLGFGSSIIFDEINAGLGYIVFLTSIIAKKFSYEFKNYELIPMGNYSKILKKKTGYTVYELNTSGTSKLSTEKFNEALVNLLDAIKELDDYLILYGKISTYNYDEGDINIKIGNGEINGYSIKYDYNHPENWSQCMKLLLILLKNYIYNALKKEDEEYKSILDKAKILTNINY